jgi:hypothetical protein
MAASMHVAAPQHVLAVPSSSAASNLRSCRYRLRLPTRGGAFDRTIPGRRPKLLPPLHASYSPSSPDSIPPTAEPHIGGRKRRLFFLALSALAEYLVTGGLLWAPIAAALLMALATPTKQAMEEREQAAVRRAWERCTQDLMNKMPCTPGARVACMPGTRAICMHPHHPHPGALLGRPSAEWLLMRIPLPVPPCGMLNGSKRRCICVL